MPKNRSIALGLAVAAVGGALLTGPPASAQLSGWHWRSHSRFAHFSSNLNANDAVNFNRIRIRIRNTNNNVAVAQNSESPLLLTAGAALGAAPAAATG